MALSQFGVLLSFLFCFWGCSPDAHGPAPVPIEDDDETSVGKYLALGDSYTIGQDVAETDRWPLQFTSICSQNGVNFESVEIIARTGWTTGNLLQALSQTPPAQDFGLVSLLIGVNNEYQYRSIEEFKQEFETLLGQCVTYAGGKKERVFVVSIPDYGYTPYGQSSQQGISARIDLFNEASRVICDRLGIFYIDITPISRQWNPEWVADDGLHPSGEQYAAWAAKIWEEMKDRL